jgi:predicted Fe-Mo cluster-binding NifX family protein
MRIAIATYGEMISPRFDCASTLRVLEYSGNGQSDRREELLQLTEGDDHAGLLLRQGVTALLCGGIRRCDYQRLTAAGVEVVAGQFGPWLDVFREYLAGRLKSQPSWERPPGCGPHGRGAGQGRGQGRGQGQGQGRGCGRPGRGGGFGPRRQ